MRGTNVSVALVIFCVVFASSLHARTSGSDNASKHVLNVEIIDGVSEQASDESSDEPVQELSEGLSEEPSQELSQDLNQEAQAPQNLSTEDALNTAANTASSAVGSNEKPTVTLKARPISCATLRQGQPCYVRFSMSWESDQPVTACLVSEQSDAGMCWENERSGEFRKTMYLSETTRWDLLTDQGESLGDVQVRVAWVYRSSRVRRNWRLF